MVSGSSTSAFLYLFQKLALIKLPYWPFLRRPLIALLVPMWHRNASNKKNGVRRADSSRFLEETAALFLQVLFLELFTYHAIREGESS